MRYYLRLVVVNTVFLVSTYNVVNIQQYGMYKKVIAKPNGHVMFAGEHTEGTLAHGWINTALASGVRAAIQIMAQHCERYTNILYDYRNSRLYDSSQRPLKLIHLNHSFENHLKMK